MFKSIAQKFFGTENQRLIKSFEPVVKKINNLEEEFSKLSDDDLILKTKEFKNEIKEGKSLDDILPYAFANVREAGKRSLGQRHFDVQIIGGIILHKGMISEMKTGEGKTLVATLAAYLNALEEKGVHIVTVNDYLAKRDAEWMGKVFEKLGLVTSFITNDLNDIERKKAYAADITYGTNNEFGFDYLRDNMKYTQEQIVQRAFHYAIVDEVDSILIDEARTPLIISGPSESSSSLYKKIDKLISKLNSEDYEKDEKSKTISISETSMEKVERIFIKEGLLTNGSLYDVNNVSLIHHTNQALKARFLFSKDVDYLVQNGKVLIIDEFTGRAMEGRRFSEGLHQALEAKENLEVQQENQTLAAVTYQNYFRLYKKLSGMTGTAKTEADEFFDIYKLSVVEVPTNQSMVRKDFDDEIYRTENEKYNAIIKLIKECQSKKQPCLVGTISIENSEHLSKLLNKENIKHKVLNAKQHEKEAEIIADAGLPGAVTIATNMAGRGTDIKLGGNDISNEQKELVIKSGGLFIIGTERHESRRIDNQLRGRSGRQGDPGSSKFFLSLDDDLMRIFGSEKLDSVLQKLGLEDGESIQHPWISKALERAQKKVEARNFEIRKSLLKFDDVMNEQRKIIYLQRNEVIKNIAFEELILDMRHEYINFLVNDIIPDINILNEETEKKVVEEAKKKLNIDISFENIKKIKNFNIDDITLEIKKSSDIHISKKKTEYGSELFTMAEKSLLLQIIDQSWRDHLLTLDHLRQGISLRAYGQRDPLNEYKHEAFIMFEEMMQKIRENVSHMLSFVEIKNEVPKPDSKRSEIYDKTTNQGVDCLENSGIKKLSRNARCPKTGKKYKNCCGRF